MHATIWDQLNKLKQLQKEIQELKSVKDEEE